jgi:TolB-like protein/Tfp pilus assembly protein PilF
MSRLRQIIAEIHRRSLWRVVGIYLVGSWLAYQVILGLTEGGILPLWFPPVAVGLFLVGLPVVVATAFVQEGLPGGSRALGGADPATTHRDRGEGSRSPTRQLLTWRNATAAGVVMFVLALAGGALLFAPARPPSPEASLEAAPARITLAALPFANLSGDADDEYFTDGIHDEILTQLFKISSLSVTSRTSVMGYRDTAVNLRQIAGELGVRYILEGTVRRFGDRVRVTAQLIDAATDEHVWADSYDRDRTDLLDIQSEVARQIALQLQAELTPAEVARIADRPTDDVVAYDFYLRGLDYARAGYVSDRDSRGARWRTSINMFESAIERDPGFALASAVLGFGHLRLYWYGYDRSPERLRLGRDHIMAALSLAPDLPQGHMFLGYYYYWGERDYDRALAEFRGAQVGLPGHGDLNNMVGYVERRRGNLAEAARALADGFERDPLNGNLAEEVGNTFRGLRSWEDAATYLNRAIAMAPDYPDGYLRRIDLLVSWTGATRGARQVLAEAEAQIPAKDLLTTAVWIETLDRDPDAALRRLDAFRGDALIDEQYMLRPLDLLYGEVLRLAGRHGEARERYLAAREHLDALATDRPHDYRVHRALALAHSGLGQHDMAITAAERAMEILPFHSDRWAAADLHENLALVLARAGRHDDAVRQLRFLLDNPSRNRITVPLLRLDPVWDPLRPHAGFRRLLDGR